MLSTPKLKQNDDPHDVLVVAPDVALVVPTDEELSKLAHTFRHPSAPQIRTDPTSLRVQRSRRSMRRFGLPSVMSAYRVPGGRHASLWLRC